MSVRRFFAYPWLLLVALVLGVALFAACGGDDDDNGGGATNAAGTTAAASHTAAATGAAATTAAATPNGIVYTIDPNGDPCSLVTPAEIGAVLGGTWNEGALDDHGDCKWENDTGFQFVFISINGASVYDQDVGALEMDELSNGPGDKRAWGPSFRTLDVLDGDRTIQVQIGPNAIQEPKAEAIAIAEKALD